MLIPSSLSISIPYSSIKRGRRERRPRLSVISIPYSSIKSPDYANGTVHGNWFQFHIVRLKAPMRTTCRHHNRFQFHIVRLKVRRNLHWIVWNAFQFHIVRLKAAQSRTCWRLPNVISIPYSSIKSRRQQLHSNRIHFISIPYSSIKSISIIFCKQIIVISIPYSSIKSGRRLTA